MPLSNAEKQARYRAKRATELAALRAGTPLVQPATVHTVTGLNDAEYKVVMQALAAYRKGASK